MASPAATLDAPTEAPADTGDSPNIVAAPTGGAFSWPEEVAPDAGATPAPAAAPETPASPAPDVPEAPTDQAALSIDDDQLERLLKEDRRAQERIDRLAQNRAGNLLQKAREEGAEQARRDALQAAAEAESDRVAWSRQEEALSRFEAMNDPEAETYDPEKFQSLLQQPDTLVWLKAVQEEKQRREMENHPVAQRARQEFDQYRSQYDQAFNAEAIDEFQKGTRALLPYFDELPEPARKAITEARYDPNGNWFMDALGATFKGIDARWQKKLDTAVAAAREAAKNEALADADSDAPVIVNNAGPNGWNAREIRDAHAYGTRPVGRDELAWAYKQLGID